MTTGAEPAPEAMAAPVRGRGRDRVVTAVGGVALVVALLAVPTLFGGVGISLTERILALALLGVSVDILNGYGGRPSLGQGAFFGAAGYTAGLLITRGGTDSFLVVSLAAVLLATALAALFGLAALRTAWIYFLLVTFAFGELLATAALQIRWLQTPGVEGMTGVRFSSIAPGLPWTSQNKYWALAVMALLTLWAARVLLTSPFGAALYASSQRPARMQALGYNTWLLSYVAFVIAGAVGAVGGLVSAYSNGIVIPTHLSVLTSAQGLLVILIGGSRRISGALLGATLVVLVQHWASAVWVERWPVVVGALYVLAAFFTRYGMAGLLSRGAALVARRRGWIP